MKGDIRPVRYSRASSPTCSHAFVPYSVGTSTGVPSSTCCRISCAICACANISLQQKNVHTQIHSRTTHTHVRTPHILDRSADTHSLSLSQKPLRWWRWARSGNAIALRCPREIRAQPATRGGDLPAHTPPHLSPSYPHFPTAPPFSFEEP